MLRRVTRAIRKELRRGDSFYRYGGEEFLAILPEQSIEQGASVMDRVRMAVERLRIPHSHSASLPYVTVSIGVAELSSGSAGGTEGWLGRADRALYAAKAHGRNRVETERSLETLGRSHRKNPEKEAPASSPEGREEQPQ